jgi:hypothetical protein
MGQRHTRGLIVDLPNALYKAFIRYCKSNESKFAREMGIWGDSMSLPKLQPAHQLT